MPIIRIDYNLNKIDTTSIEKLSIAIQNIVSTTTGIADVFVYAQSTEIQINTAPVEIFIEMSREKIVNIDVLIKEVKNLLIIWKKEDNFTTPINLTLIPMDWIVEIGI